MRRPPGVFIRAAEITTRLHAGDVVTAIDGAPATPEVLDRARQGTRDVRLEVEPATGAARRVRWPRSRASSAFRVRARAPPARRGAPPLPARPGPETRAPAPRRPTTRWSGAVTRAHLGHGEQEHQRPGHAHHQRARKAVDPQPRADRSSATAFRTSRPFDAHQARPRPRAAVLHPLQQTGDTPPRRGRSARSRRRPSPLHAPSASVHAHTLHHRRRPVRIQECTFRSFSGNPPPQIRRMSRRRCADETPVSLLIALVILACAGGQ
jgi:hypothetical protein